MSRTAPLIPADSYALVTGGSSGIGRHYAEQLARDYGCNLFLVSNQEKELAETAADLQSRFHAEVHTLCLDLAEGDAAQRVFDFSREKGMDVRVLVNNAGLLIFNPLVATPYAKINTLLEVHTVTLTKLCRLFARHWIDTDPANRGTWARRRPSRFILNMSSMSAWMAMPGIQCYNATKAYVLGFSKALWYELRPYGIRVLAVTPGSTNTGLLPFPEGFARLLRGAGITMEPSTLVRRVLRVLFRSWRKTTMPGAWNRIIVPVINHLPDRLVFAVMKRLPLFALDRTHE